MISLSSSLMVESSDGNEVCYVRLFNVHVLVNSVFSMQAFFVGLGLGF